MALQVGRTHDVVLYVNNSIQCGLTIKPFTYRVRRAPTFIPRMSVGDIRGADASRWKSWVQARFDGGAGQVFLSAPQGNNRFAESNMVDIGLPVTVVGGMAGRDDPITAAATPGGPLDDDPVGDIQVALRPRATTAITPLATLFTNAYPAFALAMSNRPHIFHLTSAVVYTSLTGPDVWAAGAINGVSDALTGKWAAINTQLPGRVRGAVNYSGVGIVSVGASGLRVYGPTPISGVPGPSALYEPAYSTVDCGVLATYDNRIWRTHASLGQAAFWDPDTCLWSDLRSVGDAGVPIVNSLAANGKLYFGKEDSLWVFDAGRIYEIHSFADERDPNNFRLMVEHRASLYFNVRQSVYRISSGGLLEKLQTPNFNGVVTGGTATGGELHILVRSLEGDAVVWVFNPETGGTRQWFDTRDLMFKEVGKDRAPGSMLASHGYVFISPTTISAAYNSLGHSCPITAVNRLNPSKGMSIPYFGQTHAYAITSMTDFGLPEFQKQLDKIIVNYTLYSTKDRIDVYYLTGLFGPTLLSASFGANEYAANLSNGSTDPTSGSMNVTVGADDVVYLGFAAPCEAVRVILDEANSSNAKSYTLKYYNGTSVVAIQGAVDATENLTASQFITLGYLPKWTKKTVQGYEAYYLELHFAGTDKQVVFTEVDGIGSLRGQSWQFLGSITSQVDVRQEISFPDPTLAHEIMLKFDLWGTDTTRPEIRRLVIRYLEVGEPYLTVDFVAVAADDLVRLDLVRENSASFIATTVYSLSGAGRTYVAGIPWPNPVGQTVRAKVIIADPGAMPPVFPYEASFAGAEIPIRLEEL